MEGWREEQVRVDGAILNVFRRGSGRPFYWCHGITSNSTLEADGGLQPWQQLVEGWEVVLTDLRGHGGSSGGTDPDAYLWSRLATDLIKVQNLLGHTKLIAGGVSMGAAIALHAAVTEPERIAALVLMIPPTAWQARIDESERYNADADLVEQKGIDALVVAESQREGPPLLAGFYDPPAAARARMKCISHDNVPAILRGAAKSDLPHPAAIAELTQPTLILAWPDDPGHPLSTTETLGTLLPQATVEVARDLRDLMNWPRLVADFCSDLDI